MSERCLTVRQPWASLIIAGTKTVEHRRWRTDYRGELWIHAGLAVDDTAADTAHEPFATIRPLETA